MLCRCESDSEWASQSINHAASDWVVYSVSHDNIKTLDRFG